LLSVVGTPLKLHGLLVSSDQKTMAFCHIGRKKVGVIHNANGCTTSFRLGKTIVE
jgi:hypothetical protein